MSIRPLVEVIVSKCCQKVVTHRTPVCVTIIMMKELDKYKNSDDIKTGRTK